MGPITMCSTQNGIEGYDMNEIRDFIERCPKRIRFDGSSIIYYDKIQRLWIEDMDSGSIHERINRRSGYSYPIPPPYAPWRGVRASVCRHRRNQFRKEGLRWEYQHLSHAT